MRIQLFAAVAVFYSVASVLAQSPAPAANGNRANGFSYQPTPGEVIPREKAAGVQPPTAQRNETNRTLERMDKKLLRDEGQSTKSVPKMAPGH